MTATPHPTPVDIHAALSALIEVAQDPRVDKATRAAAAAEGLGALRVLEQLLETADRAADSLGELAIGGFASPDRPRQLYTAIAAARGLDAPSEPYRQSLF
mgnify:CR=1 FL=1